MESRPHMLWESNDWSSGGMLYLAATEMTLSTGWDVSCDVPQNNCLGWRHYCSYTCNWILLDDAKSSHSSLERVNHNLLCNVSDEKPFKCSQCESSFRKSSGLKQHVTRQHSQNTAQKSTQAQANQASNKKNSSANDRPYACQVTLTSPPVRKAYFTIHSTPISGYVRQFTKTWVKEEQELSENKISPVADEGQWPRAHELPYASMLEQERAHVHSSPSFMLWEWKFPSVLGVNTDGPQVVLFGKTSGQSTGGGGTQRFVHWALTVIIQSSRFESVMITKPNYLS